MDQLLYDINGVKLSRMQAELVQDVMNREFPERIPLDLQTPVELPHFETPDDPSQE